MDYIAYQAFLSFTISWNLLKLMSIESVMPSSHFILCRLPFSSCPQYLPASRSFPMSHRLEENILQHFSFSRWSRLRDPTQVSSVSWNVRWILYFWATTTRGATESIRLSEIVRQKNPDTIWFDVYMESKTKQNKTKQPSRHETETESRNLCKTLEHRSHKHINCEAMGMAIIHHFSSIVV